MKIWWRSGQLYHEFLWFKRKTPSPLCVNKKNRQSRQHLKKSSQLKFHRCFQASPSSWLTWGLVCKLPIWETSRMLGADLVTQIDGEHPTNWRIDSKCQIVSSTDNWKTPSRWKICLKDVRVVGAPGHIFYDACRLLNIISKSFFKKTCFIAPEKVFSSLSSRCAAFTLMQAFKSSLLFIWWQAENPGFVDWFFKDTPYIHLKPF